MTLTLSPEDEARLRTVAAAQGMAPEEAFSEILHAAFVDSQTDDYVLPDSPEERAAIAAALAQGEEDYKAGRWVSLEDLQARLAARIEAQTRK